MARLAEPALDPDPVDRSLIFGLAEVEAVTDEGVRHPAARTALRAGKDELRKMRNVILDSAAKIEYDGHLFVLDPAPRTAAKQSSVGRVLPFCQNEWPSLLDFAPCRQSKLARGRWPPGDWPSPGTPCSLLTQRRLATKRPPIMDDLTRDADLDHHLFKPHSRASRPFSAAAYNCRRPK